MKMSKSLALLLALCMLFSLVACGNQQTNTPAHGQSGEGFLKGLLVLEHLGGGCVNVDGASILEFFQSLLIELLISHFAPVIIDRTKKRGILNSDEVLQKCVLEADSGKVQGDVLQVKDVNGQVFFEYYEDGYIVPFYPEDICSHISEDLLRYGYPLYASQSFWYYNTEAFPENQPIDSWWQIIERNDDGSQKYRLFAKEIGSETAYLSSSEWSSVYKI